MSLRLFNINYTLKTKVLNIDYFVCNSKEEIQVKIKEGNEMIYI